MTSLMFSEKKKIFFAHNRISRDEVLVQFFHTRDLSASLMRQPNSAFESRTFFPTHLPHLNSHLNARKQHPAHHLKLQETFDKPPHNTYFRKIFGVESNFHHAQLALFFPAVPYTSLDHHTKKTTYEIFLSFLFFSFLCFPSSSLNFNKFSATLLAGFPCFRVFSFFSFYLSNSVSYLHPRYFLFSYRTGQTLPT